MNSTQVMPLAPMSDQGHILIISDTKSDAEQFERVLTSEGCEVETAATVESGLARARQGDFDVVLTDLHLSASDAALNDGLQVISDLQAAKPSLAVILMTRRPTTQTTIEAMKLGAYDSIIKDQIDWNAFTTLIHQAV